MKQQTSNCKMLKMLVLELLLIFLSLKNTAESKQQLENQEVTLKKSNIGEDDIFKSHKELKLLIDGTEYYFNITFDFFLDDPDRISKFCKKVSDAYHFEQCKFELTKRVQNAMLLLYMDHTNHMGEHLVSLGFDIRYAEGGSLYFLNLLKIKYKLASSKNIKTICETGFNLGHSSLLWLVSNLNVKVYSFDLGEHDYVIPSAKYLNKHYPGRLQLYLGDSRDTLPNFFTKMNNSNKNIKCDIFFVDGGHIENIPQLDMFWAITMLNKTNKDARILVDDLHLKDVKDVWNNMIKGNLIKSVDVIENQLPSLCINTDTTYSTLTSSDDNNLCEVMSAKNLQKVGLNRSMFKLDFGIASISSNNC
jgi:hypothetical protein